MEEEFEVKVRDASESCEQMKVILHATDEDDRWLLAQFAIPLEDEFGPVLGETIDHLNQPSVPQGC